MEGVGFNCGLPTSVAEERLSFFTFFFPKGIDVLAGAVEVWIKTPISDGGLGDGRPKGSGFWKMVLEADGEIGRAHV